jgi:hypothetical protein
MKGGNGQFLGNFELNSEKIIEISKVVKYIGES